MDLLLIETGNGGDVQLNGNDYAKALGIENQVYLAWFGGNVEQSTKPGVVLAQSFDYWANGLLMGSNPSIQYNSEFERALRNVSLTSSGRVELEAAAKKDLEFLKDMGITYTIQVAITDTDRVEILLKLYTDTLQEKIILVNLKKFSDGDFFIPDFNDDFYL